MPPPPYGPPPPAPPPPRGTNTGLIIGLVCAAVAVVLIIGAAGIALLGSGDDGDDGTGGTPAPAGAVTSAPAPGPTTAPVPSPSGTPDLLDEPPATAGGWPRDLQAEEKLAKEIANQRRTFTERTGGRLDNVITAFYRDPDGSPLGDRPAGVFYVGAEGKFGDPSVFVNTILKNDSGKSVETDPGPGGGKGVCQTLTSTITLSWCAWATPFTIGMIVPSVPGQSQEAMADLLRGMRADLERTR